jgi:hypothetical protein
MSFSQSLETTPSRRLETKSFEKYGMKFTYGVVHETIPEWKYVTKEVLSSNVPDETPRKIAEWELSGAMTTNSYVDHVYVQDDDLCQKPCRVELLSTAEGPMLGIILNTTDEDVVLLDPCVLQMQKTLNFMPIFNVGRTLVLKKSAIRAQQAPAEIILAAYPGFVIQHRMFKFQLKGKVAMQEVDIA